MLNDQEYSRLINSINNNPRAAVRVAALLDNLTGCYERLLKLRWYNILARMRVYKELRRAARLAQDIAYEEKLYELEEEEE